MAAFSQVVAAGQPHDRARRPDRRTHRRTDRPAPRRRLRHHRRPAAAIRPLRGHAAGRDCRTVRLELASRFRSDHGHFHRRVRRAVAPGRTRLGPLHQPGADADLPRRRLPAGAGTGPHGRAGQFHFAHGRHRLHHGRRHPHRGEPGPQLLRHRHTARHALLRDHPPVLRPVLRHQSLGHGHRRHHADQRHPDAPLPEEAALHDRGHGRRQPGRRGPQPLARPGCHGHPDDRRPAGHAAAAVHARFLSWVAARDPRPGAGHHHAGADRGGIDQPRHRRAFRAARRWQPGVHRPGPVQHRRRLFLGLRLVRVVQPQRRQLRSRCAHAAGLDLRLDLPRPGAAAGGAPRRLPAYRGDGRHPVSGGLGPGRFPSHRVHLAHQQGGIGDPRGDAGRHAVQPRGRHLHRRLPLAGDVPVSHLAPRDHSRGAGAGGRRLPLRARPRPAGVSATAHRARERSALLRRRQLRAAGIAANRRGQPAAEVRADRGGQPELYRRRRRRGAGPGGTAPAPARRRLVLLPPQPAPEGLPQAGQLCQGHRRGSLLPGHDQCHRRALLDAGPRRLPDVQGPYLQGMPRQAAA